MNRAPYIHNSDEIAKGLEKSLSIPAFAFHHLGLMKSNAFMEAQLSDSEERYPVLLFSHGLSGFAIKTRLRWRSWPAKVTSS